MLKHNDEGQADGQKIPVGRGILPIIFPESLVPARAVVHSHEGGRGARQREVDKAVEVAGAGPPVVGTRQEVGRECQQEGLGGAGGSAGACLRGPAQSRPAPAQPGRSRC